MLERERETGLDSRERGVVFQREREFGFQSERDGWHIIIERFGF